MSGSRFPPVVESVASRLRCAERATRRSQRCEPFGSPHWRPPRRWPHVPDQLIGTTVCYDSVRTLLRAHGTRQGLPRSFQLLPNQYFPSTFRVATVSCSFRGVHV